MAPPTSTSTPTPPSTKSGAYCPSLPLLFFAILPDPGSPRRAALPPASGTHFPFSPPSRHNTHPLPPLAFSSLPPLHRDRARQPDKSSWRSRSFPILESASRARIVRPARLGFLRLTSHFRKKRRDEGERARGQGRRLDDAADRPRPFWTIPQCLRPHDFPPRRCPNPPRCDGRLTIRVNIFGNVRSFFFLLTNFRRVALFLQL